MIPNYLSEFKPIRQGRNIGKELDLRVTNKKPSVRVGAGLVIRGGAARVLKGCETCDTYQLPIVSL